jgi:hypothetical protein
MTDDQLTALVTAILIAGSLKREGHAKRLAFMYDQETLKEVVGMAKNILQLTRTPGGASG